MASAVPQWLLGKNVTLSIKPGTINGSTGVITWGTAVSLVGVLDDISISDSVDKVSISPLDNPYRNNVILEQGQSMSITEVPQARAAVGTADVNTGFAHNALFYLSQQSFHFQVTALTKNPAGTTVQTEVGSFQFVSLDRTAIKGKNTHRLNLETFATAQSGVYEVNPVIS